MILGILLKGTIMILSTTPQIEGHTIREYKGVVTGETITAVVI